MKKKNGMQIKNEERGGTCFLNHNMLDSQSKKLRARNCNCQMQKKKKRIKHLTQKSREEQTDNKENRDNKQK